ncbi:MAG: hypothetical protein KC643_26645 [Nitrospira sp.]|nr:hypothetical protein [Nitrospira sp.]
MPGPRPSLVGPSRGGFFVQAFVPLCIQEGLVTRNLGSQLLPANPRNLFPSLHSQDAIGGIGMGTGTGMGKGQVKEKREEESAWLLVG